MPVCTRLKILSQDKNVITSFQVLDVSLVPYDHGFGLAGDEIHLHGFITAVDGEPAEHPDGY